MTRFAAPIAEQIWDMKYRFKKADGTPIDVTVEDTWRRIARALAEPEGLDGVGGIWEDKFYSILEDFKFLPGGRIIAGAGTGRNVTLMNCYVLGTIPDSMGGIFEMLKEAALTMQQGGGIGYDFSTLRPKGALVKGVDADASGPLSFMDVWDAMCRTILSAGCLHGDTLVTTDEGFLRIADIVEKKLPVNVKTHEGWKKVTNHFDNGEKEVVEVFFENGRSIVCTEEHRFHTIAENGEVVKVPLKDLGVGSTCLFATKHFEGKITSKVSDNISYVLGHYWANGHTMWRGKGQENERLHYVSICFSRCESGKKSFAKVQSILDEEGYDFRTGGGDGECDVLRIYGDSGRKFISLVGAKPYSCDIVYPEGVSDIPFIAGYFDGDGSWKTAKKGPHFTSVSEAMLKTVQDKLMDFGIPSKFYGEVRSNPLWKTLYRVQISGPQWQQRFLDVFGDWLSKIGTLAWRKSHNFVYPPQALNAVDWSYPKIKGRIVVGQNIGYQTFSDMFPESDLLKFGAIKITSIENRGVAHVYDLEVEDTHSYIANGVSVSNSRRGAMMATMRCDHPDIEDFITAKRDPARLRMFNVSVLVTDAFMDAVENDADWILHFEGKSYKTVKARELWNKIMESTYAYAEPGVIFIDRINLQNNLYAIENICATNPCGEIPLPPYGACLLGSVNLAKFVEEPFSVKARIDWQNLRKTVSIAVRMMDNVVDVTKFPLIAQDDEAKAKRRIGLGVTALADMLMMLGVRYGSDEAIKITDGVLSEIAKEAYLTSHALAEEKGAFPFFDASEFYAENTFAHNFCKDSSRHGNSMRNSHLLAIAPTGTISLIAGNVSSGIEPVFAHSYTRKVLQPDGSKTEERVVDYAVALWEKMYPGEPLPDHFVTTQDLSPMDHVRMQAVVQKYIDQSISKTVNVPEDISFDDFKAVYMEAYRSGCKGCTTYRPNDVTGSILSVEPKKEEVKSEPENLIDKALRTTGITEWKPDEVIPQRPSVLTGKTYKMKWPGHSAAIYVTINDADGQPFEIFFNTKGTEHAAWMAALSRTISAVFRRGGDVRFIAQELKEVVDPKGGAWIDGKYVPSMIAQIGQIVEDHMDLKEWNASPVDVRDEEILSKAAQCPECGEHAMVVKEGCLTCQSCGYSKCG